MWRSAGKYFFDDDDDRLRFLEILGLVVDEGSNLLLRV